MEMPYWRTTRRASIELVLVGMLCALIINKQLVRGAPTAPTSISAISDILSELDRSLSLQEEPVRTAHYHFEKQMDPYMQLHKFNSTTRGGGDTAAACNDGSSAGYYKRLNNHSKSWIIYLQGGGFCGSEEACQQRWRRSPHLMSSNFWPKSKSVDGILSSEPKDNPFLWNANHIYVPYCSSDSWSGLQQSRGGWAANDGDSSSNIAPHQFNEEEQQQQQQQHQRTNGRNKNYHNRHQYGERSVSFTFMGSRILERVFESLFEELPRESSLYEAKFVLLAGDSAGATGVLLNLDKLNKFVQLKFAALRKDCSAASNRDLINNDTIASSAAAHCNPGTNAKQAPVFRGLADSGWFLDNEPYDYMEQYTNPIAPFVNFNQAAPQQQQQQQQQAARSSQANSNSGYANSQYSDASADTDNQQPQQQQQQQQSVDCDRQRCNPLQSIKQAMLYWNGQVPASCAYRHSHEPWRCYFGYRVYQTLKTPIFVVQWLYDEAQLIVNNIGRPDTVNQWNYVSRLVNDLRASLENVTALFAPSCLSHSLIIKQTWNQININGFKLPHILNSWEEEKLANQPTIEALLAPASDSALFDWPTAGQLHNNQQQASASQSFSFRSTNQHQHLFEIQRNSDPNAQTRSSNGRSGRSRKRKRNNQQHKSSGLSSSSQSNRLGRSTAVTSADSDQQQTFPMLNDNVPEILSVTAANRHQLDSSERFRLIDSCGWPQCNRDCPITDQEYNTRSLLPY